MLKTHCDICDCVLDDAPGESVRGRILGTKINERRLDVYVEVREEGSRTLDICADDFYRAVCSRFWPERQIEEKA